MTIHKAQGSQIQLLDINLSDTFAPGQVYVALSRAVSIDCLRIRHFDRTKVMANGKNKISLKFEYFYYE
ncbi:hypothetical protein BC833DRAFT_539325, partial [Globomyces pollinis-pini]